ncbi:MAG: FMN-binding protein [Planctomycetota bacterium]|jgi:RnfABCDGE-type electron transport complex G subunit
MKDKPFFAVVYMFIVTAFFSAVLIGFARLTRDKVEANRQIAFEEAVLEVFPDIEARTNAQIHQIFTEQFEQVVNSYVYHKDGQVVGHAVPVEGQGYWAPIKGIVGIAADKQTITGVAFYQQSETPGLGARIIEPDFCDAFTGKQLAEGDRPLGIRPPGSTLKNSEIHSITGATQTCVRLEKLINDGLVKWRQTNQEGTQQ